MQITSSFFSVSNFCPSDNNEIFECFNCGVSILILPEDGRTIGRLESEKGAIGVNTKAETVGSKIGPPEATE